MVSRASAPADVSSTATSRPPPPRAAYDVTDLGGATQSTFTVPFYTGRIDPTGPILTGYSDVNSWYNSFVLTFRKRMTRRRGVRRPTTR